MYLPCSAHHCRGITTCYLRQEIPATGTLILTGRITEAEAVRRRRALKRVDRELWKGNFKAALSLVKQLQGKPGGLRGFGAAKQIPRGISSVDELKLDEVEISTVGAMVDSILESIRSSIQLSLSHEEEATPLGPECLTNDKICDSLSEDHLMCMQHEAGHFLVGYFLGVFPKVYRLPSVEDLRLDNCTEGEVGFCGFEFLEDVYTETVSTKNSAKGKLQERVNRSKISSTRLNSVTGASFHREQQCPLIKFFTHIDFQFERTLNRFLCVLLGGLAAEHLVFGYSEGLHDDVEKLFRVLDWLGFTEKEVEHIVKWAVINTVLILARHSQARSRLVDAMAFGRSVGFCIDTIENTLDTKEI